MIIVNKSTCSAIICQPSDHELKHDIGTQCGATQSDRIVQVTVIVNQTQNSANPTKQLLVGTRPSKYTKILAGKVPKVKVETVRKMTPPPMPTTGQVIGTVPLDPIDYVEFVQTFNAPRQNIEQWTMSCVEIPHFIKFQISSNCEKLWKLRFLEELAFSLYKSHFEDFEEKLFFDSKTLICKNCDFSCCYFECLFFKFQEISGNWFSGSWFMLYLLYWGNC